MCCCIALGPRLLADPDTYSHVALGRWILEHHTVPTTDPFSATLRGTHWVAFEWLSQVTFAAAYAIGGWTAVVVLPAAAVSITIGSADPISAARMAADRNADGGAHRVSADCAAHPGAATYSRAAGHGGMDHDADPRRRHAQRPASASHPADDAVGESARQLHVRSCDDRADRMRCDLACDAGEANEARASMGLVRRARLGRGLHQSLRPGNDSGHVPHRGAGRGADDGHRMAAAGFQPHRHVRTSSCSPDLASRFIAASRCRCCAS